MASLCCFHTALTVRDPNIPVVVSGVVGATAVVAGVHSCALLADTTIKCWGFNGYGQLGSATLTVSNTPVAVAGISGVTAMVAGGYHSCALLSDTTVKCWGFNGYGQLGNGTNTDSYTPVSANGL